jgi:hypothetical protein
MHQWTFTALGLTSRVETCEKCGLLRIVTLSGEYYFTRIDAQHAACPSPYREMA